MNEIIILQMSKDELREIIREEINNGFKEFAMIYPNNPSGEPLLKIDDICDLLKVSRVTVHKWKKSEQIPYHRISNRIFFKRSEILESMKSGRSGEFDFFA